MSNTAARQVEMTAEEFLQWNLSQDERYELTGDYGTEPTKRVATNRSQTFCLRPIIAPASLLP
jgi:hypothetical protein